MCTEGINTADFKLALHQQIETARLLERNIRQWGDLAKACGQADFGEKVVSASARVADIVAGLEEATAGVEHLGHEHTVTKI